MKASDILKDIINDLINSITTSSEGEELMNKLVKTYGEIIRKAKEKVAQEQVEEEIRQDSKDVKF